MIKLQDLTPQVYYQKSRDFQFIGRLYDIVLNYVKTGADNVYSLPIGTNMNERLLNLLALSLGFQSKHHYNAKQLAAICSVLPKILRNKGSLNAMLIAVNALLHAEGIKQPLDYSIDSKKAITLYLPEQLSDLSLLRDLLAYILPAGISCRMVKEVSELHTIETNISTWDEINIYANNDITDPAILGSILRPNEAAVKAAMTNNGAKGKPGMLMNTIITRNKVITTNQSIAPDPQPSIKDPNIQIEMLTFIPSEITIRENESINLYHYLNIQPDIYTDNIKFLSSNKSVIKVDDTGIATAVGIEDNTAIITASSMDNPAINAEITITIKANTPGE